MMSTTKSMQCSADHRRKESEYRYHQQSNKKSMESAPSLLSIATAKPRLIASGTPWLVPNDSSSSDSTATATLEPPASTSTSAMKSTYPHPNAVHSTTHNINPIIKGQQNYARRNKIDGFDLSPSITKASPSRTKKPGSSKVATGSTQKTLVQPEGDSQYKPPLDIFSTNNSKAAFQIRQPPPTSNNSQHKRKPTSKKLGSQYWIALSILIACLSASNTVVSANIHSERIQFSRISAPSHPQQSSTAFQPFASSLSRQNVKPFHFQSHRQNALQIRGGAVASKIKTVTTQTPTKEATLSEEKEDGRILMLIRVLFLLYYGSLGSLMPYLPVYYHSLGHGGEIIGMLGAVKPLTTFLVAPLWGALSDGSSNPFLILKLTFVISLVGQLAVSFSHDHLYIMFMVFLTALFNAPVKSLLDSMVMDHLHHRSSYGRLRLWGQLGFGLGSSGMGYLLSKSNNVDWKDTFFSEGFEATLEKYPVFIRVLTKWASQFWQSLTGYKLLFFAHAALSLPTWICIRQFQKLDAESKSDHDKKVLQKASKTVQKKAPVSPSTAEHTGVGRGLSLVFRNPDALLFFFLVLVVGISSGLIENFAYVRIREVGGTGKEMGISRLVSSLAGAPMFWFSGPLSKALGVDRVLVVSLLNYVLRFLIYSMMRNPYHGLPAEALRGLTFAAFWSSCTIYAHKVSPPGLHATMLMLLNALYGGLGQSLGAILGGKMQHAFGTVKTFCFAAAADAVFVLAVIFYLSVRTESSFRDPQPIEDPKAKKSS